MLPDGQPANAASSGIAQLCGSKAFETELDTALFAKIAIKRILTLNHTQLVLVKNDEYFFDAPLCRPQSVEGAIGGNAYVHNKVNQWTSSVVEQCLNQLTKLGKPFKYIGMSFATVNFCCRGQLDLQE